MELPYYSFEGRLPFNVLDKNISSELGPEWTNIKPPTDLMIGSASPVDASDLPLRWGCALGWVEESRRSLRKGRRREEARQAELNQRHFKDVRNIWDN